MIVMHGVYCPQCQDSKSPAPVDPENLPCCVSCGVQMRTDYSYGNAAGTDVLGVERTSNVHDDEHGNPLRYTSTRDLEQKMKRLHPGFECIGDKQGGARNVHRLNGTIFSGAGMGAGASRPSSE